MPLSWLYEEQHDIAVVSVIFCDSSCHVRPMYLGGFIGKWKLLLGHVLKTSANSTSYWYQRESCLRPFPFLYDLWHVDPHLMVEVVCIDSGVGVGQSFHHIQNVLEHLILQVDQSRVQRPADRKSKHGIMNIYWLIPLPSSPWFITMSTNTAAKLKKAAAKTNFINDFNKKVQRYGTSFFNQL